MSKDVDTEIGSVTHADAENLHRLLEQVKEQSIAFLANQTQEKVRDAKELLNVGWRCTMHQLFEHYREKYVNAVRGSQPEVCEQLKAAYNLLMRVMIF